MLFLAFVMLNDHGISGHVFLISGHVFLISGHVGPHKRKCMEMFGTCIHQVLFPEFPDSFLEKRCILKKTSAFYTGVQAVLGLSF